MKIKIIMSALCFSAAVSANAATSSKSLKQYTCKTINADDSQGFGRIVSASSETRAVELAMAKYNYNEKNGWFTTNAACLPDNEMDYLKYCFIKEIICERK